ncbi:flagellar hook protein FlgE [Sphingomonas sp. CFBP 13720]|uniref:flagellar hook protein FlgE n=1 Tax=Sphingomonas sp. CFBP 13720 TaxID=2775302 RepID=UPI00177ADAEA|nr:flagellar hook protein FlgE [Sphingomonas sp. CFBP 13720]MBD8677830.1 flagellar hook protein FlgE [Sphingomonas sp. CFBP 13720]
MSFYTSLSGLKSAQNDMASISHNLANVATSGFKKSRAEFADVIASNFTRSPTQMIGSGSVMKANRQQFSEGSMIQSSGALDLAVSGDGFFAVKNAGVGSGVNYTRSGAFRVDADQYVTDKQGNRLQIYRVDGSGNLIGSTMGSLTDLRLPPAAGDAKATTAVALAVNINAKASVPATAGFDRFDATSYNQSTTTTVYDAGGNPMAMTSYFKRTTPPVDTVPGAPADLSGEWSVYSFIGDQPLLAGTDPSVTMTFDTSGALTAPAGTTTFASFMPASGVAEQQLTLSLAGSGSQATPFRVGNQTQDGIAIGELQGVTVDDRGLVKASYSNGEVKTLGQVALIQFANPAGLRQLGDSTWSATGVSGQPVAGASGDSGSGSIKSGMIEGSNVDITEELVGLIAAQRSFQANAKALDTAGQISESILNIRS